MWSEWLRTGKSLDITKPIELIVKPHELDLEPDLKKSVCEMVDAYLVERGQDRFVKQVINELINGEKDLYWFKKRLSKLNSAYSEEVFWQNLFNIRDEYSIKSLRLFQLNLFLINYFREQAFKLNTRNNIYVS